VPETFAMLARAALVPAFEILASPVTWLEIVAFWLSIWMVMCNMRVDPLAWPLAMAASALYGVLFASSKLYGEAGLQLVFIVVALWGWHQWLKGHGDDGGVLKVRTMAASARLKAALATALAWPLLALLLMRATDSDVPWLDALPTVGSITGQWMLGRKYLENWVVWAAVNAFSVGLFAYKGLWLTVALYAVFGVLSWAGWRQWRRMITATAG
jgi:nicotinamide mononucleotide transporter